MFRKRLVDIQHGIYSTRVYVVLLCIGILVLTVYTSMTIRVQSITIENPTAEQFKQLQEQHPKLSCPCQSPSTSYSSIITVKLVFHEVCSSAFIENDVWMKYWPFISVNRSNADIYLYDFRRTGATFFNLLQTFCNVMTKLMVNVVNNFESEQFFRVKAIAEEEFDIQMKVILETFHYQVRLQFLPIIDKLLKL